jgi:hypothetical protein
VLPKPVYQAGGITPVGMDLHHKLIHPFEPAQVLASLEDGEFTALNIRLEQSDPVNPVAGHDLRHREACGAPCRAMRGRRPAAVVGDNPGG